MNEFRATVAKNITQLRCAKGMTQLELGEALNYSDKSVSKWERAESLPDIYVIKQIADLFEVTVDFLLVPHTEQELPTAVEPVPPARKRLARNTITTISVLGVFSLATLIFAILFLCKNPQWLIFVYAVPVSIIVWIVLNAVWGTRVFTIFLISALLWSIITAVYLTFLVLGSNFWILFAIGVIPQIILFLCPLLFRKK